MNNFFDWDTAIIVTVLAGYILAGVFVERWMDEKFFDPNRERKDVSWREVLCVMLWIFYLPMVALLVRMGVKYRKAPKSEYFPPKREPYTGYRAEPNLASVVIPESVKEICDCAFWECSSLAELHLLASLKKLGDAFDGSCYDGMDLYCHMPEPIPYSLESDEGYPPNTHDRLFVPKGAREKYEAAEPWSYYETIKEFGSCLYKQ